MRTVVLFSLAAMTLGFTAAAGCSGAPSGAGLGAGGTGGSAGSGGGGSGGSGGGSQGGAFNCDYKEATYEYCYSYTGLTPEQTTAEEDACKAFAASSTPASCPTANKSGCCENVPQAGLTIGYCLYDIPSDALGSLKSACLMEKGTWSGKTGGAGGSGGSGGSLDGGPVATGDGSTDLEDGSGDDASEDSASEDSASEDDGGGPAPTTCAEVNDTVGCCLGDDVYYCNAAMAVVSKSCGAGTVCGWNGAHSYYGCVAPPGGVDPMGTYPEACPSK